MSPWRGDWRRGPASLQTSNRFFGKASNPVPKAFEECGVPLDDFELINLLNSMTNRSNRLRTSLLPPCRFQNFPIRELEPRHRGPSISGANLYLLRTHWHPYPRT